MYKISEFSILTGLSIQTLRYYDREKILIPSYRDKNNNYRYYNEEDYEKAKLIIMLKKYDFSILEIKEVIYRFNDLSELSYIMKEKKDKIKKNIERQQKIINLIDEINIKEELSINKTNYNVQIIDVPEIYVMYNMSFGDCCDIKDQISKLVKEAKDYLLNSPFLQYNSINYNTNMELMYAIEVKSSFDTRKFNCKHLSGYKALSVTHCGNYETLHLAYKAIFDYADKMNIKLCAPVREIYHKSPSVNFNGNKNLYITEIQVGIE